MSFGSGLYRIGTSVLSPFVGIILKRRVSRAKEDAARLNERHAKALPPRPHGPLIWLHGASVGESRMLLGLGERLLKTRPDLTLLYTSQTQTSARLLGDELPDRALHQMLPIDTPGRAKRFVSHWQPDLCIFGEGEIWPNLMQAAEASGAKRALVNARMTEKSLKGWGKWKGLLQTAIGRFDIILAADAQTAAGLGALLSRPVETPGNLKSALPAPDVDTAICAILSETFIAGRPCYVAASTHEGEEALFIDALKDSGAALIIAPRHPERGDEIEAHIKSRSLQYVRRSTGGAPTARCDVLLADTLGEMGLWYSLANSVYLGGGHREGIGGHNPLEPLQFGKPVITGPHTFNFADLVTELVDTDLISVVASAEELGRAMKSAPTPASDKLERLAAKADAPMVATLNALLPLLPPAETA